MNTLILFQQHKSQTIVKMCAEGWWRMYQLKLQIAVQVEFFFASVGQLLETQEQSPSNCQRGL